MAESLASRGFSWSARSVGTYVGLVVTPACFLLGGLLAPEWQSNPEYFGSEYVGLLLSPRGTWPFYFFIAYSLVCMLITLYSPSGARQQFCVRFGLHTGVLWSLQYVIMLSIGLSGAYSAREILCKEFLLFLGFGFFETLVPLVSWHVLREAFRKVGPRGAGLWIPAWVAIVWASAFLFIKMAGSAFDTMSLAYNPLLWPIVLSLLAAPFWSLSIYSWLSWRVLREVGWKRLRLYDGVLSFVGWAAALRLAWKLSIYSAMKYYETLPTEPPDCYIATAAAKGHRRVVGSEDVALKDGRVVRINRQMRYLKCGEIMLGVAAPGVHRFCRGVYNLAGPVLAKAFVWAIAADAAYLALKPAEWGTRAVLKMTLGDCDDVVRGIYRFDGDER